MTYTVQIIFSALSALIALTVHEFSHGFAAYKLGDNTAKSYGRLTLNPIKHLDPFGAICLVFFRFGWAKPVPINPRNFKKPKRDFAISALAGPLSNLLLSFFTALLYVALVNAFSGKSFESELAYNLAVNLTLFIYIFHAVNLGLAIFNLIPVPPLDGSRLLNVILPTRIYFKVMRYERQIYLGLIAWLFIGDIVKTGLLSVPFIAQSSVLSGIAGVFSLSDLLGLFIAKISDLIFSFWSLFF